MDIPKETITKFLKNIEKRLDISGVLISGSYSRGEATINSDIDLRIILKNNDYTNERSVIKFEGYELSYFARNFITYSDVFNEQLINHSKFEARVVATSKIFTHPNNQICKALINKAKKIMKKNFLDIGNDEKVTILYSLWNHFKKTSRLDVNSKLFNYNYFILLNHFLNSYCQLVKNEYILEDKLELFFNSIDFRNSHLMEDLPDSDFKILFMNACEQIDKSNLNKLMDFMDSKFDYLQFKQFRIQM